MLEYLHLSRGGFFGPHIEDLIRLRSGHLEVDRYYTRTVFGKECVRFHEELSKDRSKRWLQKFEQIRFEEWDDEYWADVCDGEQWSIVYQYSGEEKKRSWGSNAYPKNWQVLIYLLNKLTYKLPRSEGDIMAFLHTISNEEKGLERSAHRRTG